MSQGINNLYYYQRRNCLNVRALDDNIYQNCVPKRHGDRSINFIFRVTTESTIENKRYHTTY